MFSSRTFTVSGLPFKSLIHFEFIFVYSVINCLSNYFSIAMHFPQHHLLKKRVFSPLYVLVSFVYRLSDHKFIGLFLGCILFHWSVCPFLCQYQPVLITAALSYSLKSGIWDSSSYVLLSQNYFDYSRSYVVPHKF